MYFTVDTAFVHYLDQLDNLADSSDVLILMDKTTFEQTLPISLNTSNFATKITNSIQNTKRLCSPLSS